MAYAVIFLASTQAAFFGPSKYVCFPNCCPTKYFRCARPIDSQSCDYARPVMGLQHGVPDICGQPVRKQTVISMAEEGASRASQKDYRVGHARVARRRERVHGEKHRAKLQRSLCDVVTLRLLKRSAKSRLPIENSRNGSAKRFP